MNPQTTTRKQAQSEGGGAPQWLVELGVGPGEFYQTSKAQPRRIMKDPGWSEKSRVWACLSLHTMAFQCEEATKLVKGQRMPLTRGDIAAETGLAASQVRRALVGLELEGYLERRALKGGKLRQGEITIHCWAIPRPAKQLSEVAEDSRPVLEVPEDLPLYLQRWIKKLRLEQMPEPEVLEKAGILCETLSATETELKHLLKPDSETQPRTPKKMKAETDLSSFGRQNCPSSIRMKDSDRKTVLAAAASSGQESTQYVLAAAALQKHFPATEQAFILGLADTCRGVLNQMQTDPERLTDVVLRDAVEVAFRPHQRSAGLFKTTLPEVIRNWVKNGGKFPARPIVESTGERRRRETVGLIDYVRGLKNAT